MIPSALLLALALNSTPVDSINLDPVVVEAQAISVCMRGDTLVFCVANFMEHSGERLKSLLQNLPGVEVCADGTIRAKGRVVDRLLINGKKLTGLKDNVLLDNLKADALVSIRLYDEVCERDCETGVVQDQEEQVMDLITREDKKQGWLCDLTAGLGTKERYSGSGSASRFSETWQNMFTATFDNLPGVFGVGESFYDKLQKPALCADTHRRNVSSMFGWEDGVWNINASAYYDGAKSSEGSNSLFESMLPGMVSSIQESSGRSESKINSLNFQMEIERHDSLTALHIDPYINWTRSQGDYHNDCRTLNRFDRLINSQIAESNTSLNGLTSELNIRLNRKIRGKKGRNIDCSLGFNHERQSETTSAANVIFYYMQQGANMHSLRLSDGEMNRLALRMKVAYVEPFSQWLKMQTEYTLALKQDETDNPVYLVDYTQPNALAITEMQRNDSLSRNGCNRELQQRGRVVFQYSSENVRLVMGGVIESGYAQTKYKRHGLRLDTLHKTTDLSPELHFTWHNKSGWNFTANYDGRTLRPSIIDLIPVEDTSNPLNIRCGNPGLKNAFVHTVSASLFYFSPESERQFNLQLAGDAEQRALTQRVSYNTHTGVRRYTMINVYGNRRLNMAWGYQSAFGKKHGWYLDLQGSVDYNRRVGEQDVDGGDIYKYVTNQQQVMQFAALQYKWNGVSVKPYAYGRYERLRSDLKGSIERDLYIYGYGAVVRYASSFGLSVAIDAYNHSRRGYVETYMNSNELIIDAEICYAFLKGRNAEVSVQINDLLGQRNMVQSYSSTSGRSETQYGQAVTSYAMASLTYRF